MTTIFQSLLILFAALNAADGWETWHIIRFKGREREGTLVNEVMKELGVYWTLVLMKVGAVAAVWYVAYFYPFDWIYLAVIDAAYTMQVYWNWQQLQKHKEK